MEAPLLHHLSRTVRRLSDLAYVIGSVAIALMMLHVVVHVLSQYLLNYPLPGTILFVSNYYMVAVTFLCLAAVELKGGHISVDLLYSRFPVWLRHICSAIALSVTATVFTLLTWQSFIAAEARRAAGTFEVEYGIKIILWPSYYLVPAGAALLTVTAVVKLICLLGGHPDTLSRSGSEPL
jgi:TRAP-type C4-dicarboxylate transport system permease small subunit